MENVVQPNVVISPVTPERIAIKCGEIIKVSTPEGLVTESGVRELQDFMFANSLGLLPDDFEPIWITRRGTLPKRIQSHVFKVHSLKLTSEQVSQIGNIAKRNTSTAQAYYLDFTRSIDWHAGDFGDGGSCFWESKSGAKLMIEDNGCAVRLYHQRTSGGGEGRGNLRGYARAWIAQIEDRKLIVFNGYGETSLAITRILAIKYSLQYRRITLVNNGTDGGTLWINGGSSYLLGDWDAIKDTLRHDLQWEEQEGEESCVCAVCDGDLDEDDATHAFNRYGETVPCCDGCTFACHRCDETYTEDCERRYEGESYCRECQAEQEREDEAKRERKQEEIEKLERDVCSLRDEGDRIEDEIADKRDRLDEIKEEITEIEQSIEQLREEIA
jgi:hypothetical protein